MGGEKGEKMKIEDVQKIKKKKGNSEKYSTSVIISLEDKKFVDENSINLSLLLRTAIKELKESKKV